MDKQVRAARLRLILSMLIFGTIGIFRKLIPLPSGVLAMSRGGIGALFLLALLLRGRTGGALRRMTRASFLLLLLSGALLGFNWILLFEAYRRTSVATATLCYYMAPMFVLLASPLLLQEPLGARKLLCCGAALLGTALVSGLRPGEAAGAASPGGVLLALAAAVLYAGIVLLNKKLPDIDAYARTFVQLAASAVALLPYVLLRETPLDVRPDAGAILLTVLVGVLHTGVAYALYFGAIKYIPAQTAALFSYIDPVAAVLLSALFLGEAMGFAEIAGAVLILGAAIVSELGSGKRREVRGGTGT